MPEMAFQATEAIVTRLVCDRCGKVSEFHTLGKKKNPNYARRIGYTDYGWYTVRKMFRLRDVCPECQDDAHT